MEVPLMAVSSQGWNVCQQVYALWSVILGVGFGATHFFPRVEINGLWLILSLLGLGYMIVLAQHPQNRSASLRSTGWVWLYTISLGMVLSVLPFMHLSSLGFLGAYLGAFWLLQMGIGHVLNGWVNPPSGPYLLTGGIQVLAGLACLVLEPLQSYQFLVAGGVGTAAMLLLIRLG
jgi:hypothetical protein